MKTNHPSTLIISTIFVLLLIGLIALVVIAGAILLGDSLVTKFSDFGSEVENTP